MTRGSRSGASSPNPDMRYEDFEVLIEPGTQGSYSVIVESPAGYGRGTFEIPSLPVTAGEAVPLAMREVVFGESRSPEYTVRDAGKALFEALFKGEVLTLFHESLGKLQDSEDRGLRIRLRFDARNPALGRLPDLPWELLYRSDTNEFLALDSRTPVVRSLDVPRPRRAADLPPRLRILVVPSSPRGFPPLDLARERRNLEEAFKETSAMVTYLESGGRDELRRKLREKPFDVLYFMGHGTYDATRRKGCLVFEAPDGGALFVDGEALPKELKGFSNLRLVVLNACHTARSVGDGEPAPFAGVAPALVLGGMPAVVAMQLPISDKAAVAFSRALCEGLAAGEPVEEAVSAARLEVERLGTEEWGIPVLFLRGVPAEGLERIPTWVRRAVMVAALLLIVFLGLMAWREVKARRSAEALELNNQGSALADQGREAEAREKFLAALKIDSDYAPAHTSLSVLEEKAGNPAGALEHARAAVEAAPGEALHHYNLGSLLARLERDEEALSSLYQAVELDLSYGPAYNELGRLYLRLDRFADARRELEAGLRVVPELAPLHKNLGRVALAEGQAEEAIRRLEEALRLYGLEDHDGREEATCWLAMAYAKAGRPADSCQQVERFQVLDPDRVSPWADTVEELEIEQQCGHRD